MGCEAVVFCSRSGNGIYTGLKITKVWCSLFENNSPHLYIRVFTWTRFKLKKIWVNLLGLRYTWI